MSLGELGTLVRPDADRVWQYALAAGLVAAAAYLVLGGQGAGAVTYLLCTVGAAAAAVLGPRAHGVRDRRPWHLFAAAAVLFCVGVLVRPLALGQAGAGAAGADAFTTAGYACTLVGFVTLVRRSWRTGQAPYVGLDILMVLLGAGSLSLAAFALPATAVPGRPWWLSLLAGMYPLFDVVFLLAQLACSVTTALRLPAFRLLTAGVVAMLGGDLGYAWDGAHGHLVGARWMGALFLLALTLLAAATTHPSMRGYNDVRLGSVHPWGRVRLAVLGTSVCLPALGVLITPHPAGGGQRAILALGCAGVALALLLRAVAAVNAQARVQEDLTAQATRDPVTALANRAKLEQTISRQLADRRPPAQTVSVLFVDIDGFKYVNESFGHAVGDELLNQVGARLAQVCGRATVARLGGDLFAVTVNDDADALAGLRTVRDVVSAFAAPLRLSVGRFDATVAVGLANSADVAAPTPAELLRAADAAMYEAKSAGRGGWARYDERIRREVSDRLEMEQALRAAVERQEFAVDYQPCVHLASGELAGLAAQIRWEHPSLGVVPVAAVRSLVEEFGLGEPVGEQVLRAAVAELARRDHLTVGVTLSQRLLASERLVPLVADLLAEHEVSGSRLLVTVAESVLAGGDAQLGHTLEGLRERGVRLAVGDFGSGGGTLEAVRRVHPDLVKLDARFVARLGRPGTDRAILAAVAVGRALGMEVSATGVETPAQQAALAALGVTYGQGWLFGRPQRSAARAAARGGP